MHAQHGIHLMLRCVNRLAWSEDGTLLVSGSDDRSMRVWRYTGDGAQQPLVVDTLHQGNIFGVAFLPATDNRELVSGAMDYSGRSCANAACRLGY